MYSTFNLNKIFKAYHIERKTLQKYNNVGVLFHIYKLLIFIFVKVCIVKEFCMISL